MKPKKQPKPKHGGTRENAGRPTLDGEPGSKRYNVTLNEKVAGKAVLLGDGNLSAGIRIAVNKILPD